MGRMLIYLLIIYILGFKSPEAEGNIETKTSELKRLDYLKYYICGLTSSNRNPTRGIGWFCVPKANCSGNNGNTKMEDGTKVACNTLRHNEGHDTCCFTKDIKPEFQWQNPNNPEWDVYRWVKNTSPTQDLVEMKDHREEMFRENLSVDIEDVLKDYEICHILPTGVEKGRITYTPYVCVTSKESASEDHDNVPWNKTFPFGDRFCRRSLEIVDRLFCCHISKAIPKAKSQASWNLIDVPETVLYAPGFRAAFMCEQYNRLVCDGEVDRCAQKVLHRHGHTLPGEFPHHALIGITQPRRQTFHCHGAIISKLFVLSSYDCREFNSILSNIVLVGTFNFTLDRKATTSANEQISYIKNHIYNNNRHWFLLLKLWRPLKLNPFVKPACIDWYSEQSEDLTSKEFDYGTGWIIGYGPQTEDGTFSTNVVRHTFNYIDNYYSKQKPDVRKVCQGRFPANKTFDNVYTTTLNHLCVKEEVIYSPFLDGRLNEDVDTDTKRSKLIGYFSWGAPFSVFQRYCQWKVYGIYIQDKRFLNVPPLMIETVPHALAWIEDIVWKEDFDWLFFDLSWPECADWENPNFKPKKKGGNPDDALHQFNFFTEDYNFIKPQYDSYYKQP